MKTYIIIAREKINGIACDEGLRALDGYAAKSFCVSNGQNLFDVIDREIEIILAEHPRNRYEDFEIREIGA